MPLQPGTRLGPYEIVSPLGAGGMGEVYRAHDTALNRDVAIKVLPDSVAGDPDRLARFRREAEALASLNHPNIGQIYGLENSGESPALILELVEGPTLADRIAEGPISVKDALPIADQIAAALEAAHARGIIHRDLKPANVKVRPDGTAKVLDFGLAAWIAPEGGPDGSNATRTQLTNPGSILGTVGYLAPEMATGRATDARVDQFALGCILYEMLAGDPAFSGESAAEVLTAVLRDRPRALSTVRNDVPPALVALVDRCLAKAPVDRFADLDCLCRELRAIAAALATPARPARTRSAGGLPAVRTRFFGREHELREIGRLLADPAVRLVTLTGGGGTGKTRLALQAASTSADEFGERIFFIPLAGLSQPDLVGPEIARVLGAQRGTASTPARAIADAVEEFGGHTLLILDNFEHLADAAPLLGEVVEFAPALTVLVTSREVLHIYGEHGYPVQPLPVAGLGHSLTAPSLAAQPAVALFVDRAQAARPSFQLDESNAAAVAELCARLDGLPLALELAAARVRMLSPADLVSRLARRLDVLTSGARDLPDRQRTLKGTIDWSHDLLNEEEQAVFRRLAVFADGFTLEGAEAVVDPHGTLGHEMTELIGSLVDKSLVHETATADPRFAFLETMRGYATERLGESADSDDTHRAHAAYFLVLGEEGAGALARGEDAGWLETFAREHDNVLAALDWLAATDNAEWALRMALSIFHYWERAELFAEGSRRLATLLALPSAVGHDALRAKALFAAGVLSSARDDHEGAAALHQASLEIHEARDDKWGSLVALNGLALDLARLERFAEARVCQEKALALGAELGDQVSVARSLSNLARVEMGQGRHDDARRCYREAAAIFSRLGDRLGSAWALNHEGDVARDQADLAGAAALYDRALAAFRELDDPWGIGSCLADLGRVRSLDGDWPGAADLFKQALRRFADLGHRRGVSRVLELLSLAAAERGQGEAALRLAGAASAIRRRLGLNEAARPDGQLDGRLRKLGETLGEAGNRARQQGEGMRWRDAVEHALEEVS